MTRFIQTLSAVVGALLLTSCLTNTGLDSGGYHYATISGTVTRANGTAVANAGVGFSCSGASNEPFGFTAEANSAGVYEAKLNAPSIFAPLTGPSYVCRVLTPYTGAVQAEKTLSIVVSPDEKARPVTMVSLVVP